MKDRAISLNAVIDALDQSINIFEAEDRIRDLPSVRPEEPCEDCISRQALQEWIKDKSFGDIVVASEHNFDCLPPVKPQEPKTGHWILSIEDWNKWTCSECGYSERTDIHVSLGYDYCPKCGARMDEPQESEE